MIVFFRYIKYFSDIHHGKIIPHQMTMRLLKMTFSSIPRFAIGGGEKGCTPFFEVYQFDKSEKFLLFSSENTEEVPTYDIHHQLPIVFYLRCMVQGDILISFKHLTPLHSTEPMFEFVFNVGMVHGGSFAFPKGELEIAEKDLRFLRDFTVEIFMEPCTEDSCQLSQADKEIQLDLFMKKSDPSPEVCFTGSKDRIESRIQVARDIGNSTTGSFCVRGGWCYKRGHKVKNWKRRWFVLRSSTFSYYKNPRDLKHLGEIPISTIKFVRHVNDDEMPFCFELCTQKATYLISASTKYICNYWVESLNYSLHLYKNYSSLVSPLGSLDVVIHSAKQFKYNGELCCTLAIANQVFIANPCKNVIDSPNNPPTTQHSSLRNYNEINSTNKSTTSYFGDRNSFSSSSSTASKKPSIDHVISFNQEFFFTILDNSCDLEIILWENDWELGRENILAQLNIPIQVICQNPLSTDWYFINPYQANTSYLKATNTLQNDKYQIQFSFAYTANDSAEELHLSEHELLYTNERRSTRLGINGEQDIQQTQHQSWSRYFKGTGIRSSRRNFVTNRPSAFSNPLLRNSAQTPVTSATNHLSTTNQDTNKLNRNAFKPAFCPSPVRGDTTPKAKLNIGTRSTSPSIKNHRDQDNDNDDLDDFVIVEEEPIKCSKDDIVQYFFHDLTVECVLFHLDILWIGDSNGYLHLWDPKTNKIVRSFSAHSGCIYSLAPVGNEICSCSSDSISFWTKVIIIFILFYLF